MSNVVRIGSRGSDLALWQARWVQRQLQERHQGLETYIDIIKTAGDKILDSPLSAIGDKGLFTREIETALLNGAIDLAVHSLKDLPTELPAGLVIGAVSKREDVRDVFIPHPRNPLRSLLQQPRGARIATGSLRRKCQLMNLRRDFEVIDLRGNLNTRLRKLEESDWGGMILARAGVVRMGWEHLIGESIPPEVILPAVGQGALGIEIREGDRRVSELIGSVNHGPTVRATTAERALLRRLEGGCQVPIGAFARIASDERDIHTLRIDAMVGSLDGRTIVRAKTHGAPEEGETLGINLAETLLAGGADAILRSIREPAPKQA